MALKDRIKEVMDAGGYSQADIATFAGVSEAAVSHWLSGRTLGIRSAPASGIEAKTGYRSAWIATGKGDKKNSTVSPGPEIRGAVPLISGVQAGMFKEFVDNFHPGDGGEELVPTSVPIKQHTFALRVENDSMEPLFTAGMVLIVEPEMDPMPNDYVIAKNGEEETTFKQLIKDGGDWFLKPLNPRYPIKPLTGSKVIGVVRAVERRFR